MIYRELGRTGMKVSEVGFGGENVAAADYENVKAILDTADEAGLNIIDAFMPQPEVRTHLGRALEGRRERFIIQGHIGSILKNGQYFRTREVRDSEEYIADFLKRLKTDYIDIGVMHYIDLPEDYDRVFNSDFITYVMKLKQTGVIRAIGASSHNPITARRLAESGVVDVILFSVNPAFDLMRVDTTVMEYNDRKTFDNLQFVMDPARSAFYRAAEKEGVGVTTMKTFAAGRLLHKETSPFGIALTPAQLIQYALDRPAVASVLLGARTPQEMAQSLAFEQTSPRERDYSVLSGCTQSMMDGKCMYCNHCLPCPSEIDVASVMKYADMLRENPGAETVRSHYDLLKKHASDCLQCGACETRCPFHVDVRTAMQEAQQLFGR